MYLLSFDMICSECWFVQLCNKAFCVFHRKPKLICINLYLSRLEQMMWKSTNGSRGSTGKTFITGSVISTTTNWTGLQNVTYMTSWNPAIWHCLQTHLSLKTTSFPPSPLGFSFILSFLRKLKPPLVPKLKYEGDTSNFDDYPEDDLNKVPGVSEREQRIFDDFWSLHRKNMGV